MDAAGRIAQLKMSGKPVLGCFPLYPPVELFHSMGLQPVTLWGLGDSAHDLAVADRHVQPYACSVARQLFEFVVTRGDMFDGLFFYNACDTLRNLPELLREGLEEAGAAVPPMFRVHVPMAPAEQVDSSVYLAGEIESLGGSLESEYGVRFSEAAFERSVGLFKRMRSLCAELEEATSRGAMAFSRFCATMLPLSLMDVEDQISSLESTLAGLDGEHGVEGRRPRVIVSGILPPPKEVCRVIDEAGLVVAGNDIASLRRSYAYTPQSWRDVADYYVRLYAGHAPCSTLLYSSDRRPGWLLSLVRETSADGLVFVGEKFCEYEYFDLPYITGLLKEVGVPVLPQEISAEDTRTEALATRIEAFAEQLVAGLEVAGGVTDGA